MYTMCEDVANGLSERLDQAGIAESATQVSSGLEPADPVAAGNPTLDPRYTFESFVVGSSNQLAHAAAKAIASQPGEKYNPLFLYGAVGLGKTHLATAIGHQIVSARAGCNVVFSPAERFINELISCMRSERMSEFEAKIRRVHVLILDDVHFLAGRERTQDEFFHAFNSLHAERRQIVLTSDKAPRELTGFGERLRNRFESGLIVDIAPPDLETRIAILQKTAEAENLRLDSEAALMVARNVSCNVRELQGCLNRLAAQAALNHSSITQEIAQEVLRDVLGGANGKPGIQSVQEHVCAVFHIPLMDLMSKKRSQRVAFCRQVAMYLCRRLTGNSFPAIGAAFGRDHSTVIHAHNLIAGRVNKDAGFARLIQKLERQLNGSCASAPDLPPARTGPHSSSDLSRAGDARL